MGDNNKLIIDTIKLYDNLFDLEENIDFDYRIYNKNEDYRYIDYLDDLKILYRRKINYIDSLEDEQRERLIEIIDIVADIDLDGFFRNLIVDKIEDKVYFLQEHIEKYDIFTHQLLNPFNYSDSFNQLLGFLKAKKLYESYSQNKYLEICTFIYNKIEKIKSENVKNKEPLWFELIPFIISQEFEDELNAYELPIKNFARKLKEEKKLESGEGSIEAYLKGTFKGNKNGKNLFEKYKLIKEYCKKNQLEITNINLLLKINSLDSN